MKLAKEQWDLGHLRTHLQYTVDLEVWTIPFYMAALYSIQDRSSKAFQSIQSIVNQEMLHVQLASNVSNAYGFSPMFTAPVYAGTNIPHLNFTLDARDPRKIFHPFSAEIGPLDELRINSMCLIEYPEYDTGSEADLRDTVTEYGSIGEFYDAVEYGAKLLERDIRGGGIQLDLFSAFYRNMPRLTVEGSGANGFCEIALLIDTIRDQGEGRKTNEKIGEAFRNTADDSNPELNHFEKFNDIVKQSFLPLTYPLKLPADVTDRDRELQQILAHNFAGLLHALEVTFAGRKPDNFESLMVTVGGNVVNCWKNGVLPTFS